MSWVELADKVLKAARAMAELGIVPGDNIGIYFRKHRSDPGKILDTVPTDALMDIVGGDPQAHQEALCFFLRCSHLRTPTRAAAIITTTAKRAVKLVISG